VFRIASRKPDVSYALFSYQNGMVVSLGHEGNEIAYAPKRIDCYAVTQENFGLGENGTKFKLDPRRALSRICYQHNAEAPDFDLVPLRDPAARRIFQARSGSARQASRAAVFC